MKKIAIVSFKGEMPCFVHALLNVWNYHERGYVCKACAAQMGTLAEAEAQGLPIDAALSGHSDLEVFSAAGFEIILF